MEFKLNISGCVPRILHTITFTIFFQAALFYLSKNEHSYTTTSMVPTALRATTTEHEQADIQYWTSTV